MPTISALAVILMLVGASPRPTPPPLAGSQVGPLLAITCDHAQSFQKSLNWLLDLVGNTIPESGQEGQLRSLVRSFSATAQGLQQDVNVRHVPLTLAALHNLLSQGYTLNTILHQYPFPGLVKHNWDQVQADLQQLEQLSTHGRSF